MVGEFEGIMVELKTEVEFVVVVLALLVVVLLGALVLGAALGAVLGIANFLAPLVGLFLKFLHTS